MGLFPHHSMAPHKSNIDLDDRQRVLMSFFMVTGKLRLFDLKQFNANRLWRLLRWMAGKYEP